MKDKSPNEDLLDAVLLDEPAHESSLRVVRRAARRRRWNRHLRHGALAVAVLAMGITLQRQMGTVEKVSDPLRVHEASYVVHSHALPKGFVVRTQEKSVSVVTTLRTGVAFFSTVNAPPPERIDDEILLQLVPGAILVRHQAGPVALVFPITANAEMESHADHQ